MDTQYGTGESGIRHMSLERYHEQASDELIEAVIHTTCLMYGVNEPSIELLPGTGNGSWRGLYHIKEQCITMNTRRLGLLVHELAHHIDRRTNGKSPHEHHGLRYKEILQELHDMWG